MLKGGGCTFSTKTNRKQYEFHILKTIFISDIIPLNKNYFHSSKNTWREVIMTALIGYTTLAVYVVPQLDVGITMLIGKNVAMICRPLQPTTFLAMGLAGVE